MADEEIRHVSDSDSGAAGEQHGPADDAPGPQHAPDSPLAQATRLHAQMAENNAKDLNAIRQMGANIDPGLFLQIRINTFIQFVLSRIGNATDEVKQMLMLEFETAFEHNCSEQLKFVKGEVRKASMGMGAGLTPEQIKQMARMDPTLGPNGLGRPGRG